MVVGAKDVLGVADVLGAADGVGGVYAVGTTEVLGPADVLAASEAARPLVGPNTFAARARQLGRSGDESHVAGEGAHPAVALDPEQAAGRVADGDHDAGVVGGPREQQRPDHLHDTRERVGAAVGLKLLGAQIEPR